MSLRTSSREYGLPREPLSFLVESIVADYFTRRCANYKITTYYNTYWPSLQLSCVAQTYPVNGFPFSGNETATAIVNENIFWLYIATT
jgi:hypothetical protein